MLGDSREVSWATYAFAEVFCGLLHTKSSQWTQMNLMRIHIAKEIQQRIQGITPPAAKVGWDVCITLLGSLSHKPTRLQDHLKLQF